jgi:RsiW-degrading membrane proteinase PrsW (M82 family)
MSTTLAAGIALGGVIISGLGAASIYALEKKQPTVKSIMRDFIIGCVLVLMLLQLLPDSVSTMMGFLPSVSSVVGGAVAMASAATGKEPSNDMEIQVGVPGF